MEDLPQKVTLTKAADQLAVSASLVPLTRSLAQEQIEGKWWHLPDVTRSKREIENDHRWNWKKMVGEVANNAWYESVAIQSQNGAVQGAMIYRTDALSFVEDEAPCVHVERLASAPRNRDWLVEVPIFRGVGESLVCRAVKHSYHLGFGGRVTLIAFDDSRTLGFYEKLGFEVIDYEAYDEGVLEPKLELSLQKAAEWLKAEGYDL